MVQRKMAHTSIASFRLDGLSSLADRKGVSAGEVSPRRRCDGIADGEQAAVRNVWLLYGLIRSSRTANDQVVCVVQHSSADWARYAADAAVRHAPHRE